MNNPILTSICTCPIQPGFQLETENYHQIHNTYLGFPHLLYQFTVCGHTNRLHVVPDGCIDILFSFQPSKPIVEVCGTVLKGEMITFKANAVYFGVRLSASQSINIPFLPFREIINKRIPLNDILKNQDNLPELLAEKSSFTERVSIIESKLIPILFGSESASPYKLISKQVQRIYRANGNISVDHLAEETGYSPRHFRKLFEQVVGISPKLFCRIIRFQQALHVLMNQPATLLEIVSEFGYYDQSHFVKEMKQFSLLTPLQIKNLNTAFTGPFPLQPTDYGETKTPTHL
ncbi:helix-turn-helix domain-containing protein [Paenibacillus turpanensis]|uniref:helix-turn-helix domain-containing protein n=1 Tax=Paenibacillus turpanensis TaxID=2689078 RepID=UPI0014072447|nr:AraC family transcriptional regulator [Paenibacillus turpanensis]